jgi:hypothetical protein
LPGNDRRATGRCTWIRCTPSSVRSIPPLISAFPKKTANYNEIDDIRHQLAMASNDEDLFTPRYRWKLPSRASDNGA